MKHFAYSLICVVSFHTKMSVHTQTGIFLFVCVLIPIALFLLNSCLHFVFWYRARHTGRHIDRVVYKLLIQPTKSFREDARLLLRICRILTYQEKPPSSIGNETSSIYENEFSHERRRSSNVLTVRKILLVQIDSGTFYITSCVYKLYVML